MINQEAAAARRRLLVMRHAEAEPFSARGGDLARELTAHGQAQATSVGAALAAAAPALPMQILCSPSQRTLQTASLVTEAMPDAPDFIVDDTLYNISPEGMFSLVHASSEEFQTVLIIGHNPTVAAFVNELAGPRLADPGLTAIQHGYPPATLTLFECSGSWVDLRPSRVSGVRVRFP